MCAAADTPRTPTKTLSLRGAERRGNPHPPHRTPQLRPFPHHKKIAPPTVAAADGAIYMRNFQIPKNAFPFSQVAFSTSSAEMPLISAIFSATKRT